MSTATQNMLYPVFLKLDKLNILIIGGGAVAAEKLHFMLKSSPNANVHVLASEFIESVLLLLDGFDQVKHTKAFYTKSALNGYDIIIAATNNYEINYKIWTDAKALGKIVNVADTPELCDFYMGSIITKGDLKIAISTNGKSPTLARRFREMLETLLPEDLPETLNNLNAIRKTLKGNFSEKVKALNKITANMIIEAEKKPSEI